MSETEKELYEILKIAFQSNLDESDYIRDSEVSHIYDKKQKKYLDFYNKRNQSNLHGLFQTETQEVLSKIGFYPLSIDSKARLKVLLDFIGTDSFEDLTKAIKLQTDKLSFDESNNLLCVIST